VEYWGKIPSFDLESPLSLRERVRVRAELPKITSYITLEFSIGEWFSDRFLV
jgi:hypothetical protein